MTQRIDKDEHEKIYHNFSFHIIYVLLLLISSSVTYFKDKKNL